jgi:hypothetical protein
MDHIALLTCWSVQRLFERDRVHQAAFGPETIEVALEPRRRWRPSGRNLYLSDRDLFCLLLRDVIDTVEA